jgi:glutathione S-transferase
MTLALYLHPLASFCHKVLIALYENGTPFEARSVDLMNESARAQFMEMWPVGKMPVLRDESRDRTVPESTIIIEYLDRYYPGPRPLLPRDEEIQLEARLWDRFYDQYVSAPVQKIVTDRIRPAGANDHYGVAEAEKALRVAYGVIEQRMANRSWTAGDSFGVADCAAAPALFFAGIVVPFAEDQTNLAAYFDRLADRPSFKRVIDEARPYFSLFPYQDRIPARFR